MPYPASAQRRVMAPLSDSRRPFYFDVDRPFTDHERPAVRAARACLQQQAVVLGKRARRGEQPAELARGSGNTAVLFGP